MNRVTDRGIWIESDVPLADTQQWTVPLRLVKAVADGETANLGRVPPLLGSNLETIRDIYNAWIGGGNKVHMNFEIASDAAARSSGVSMFFSGGLDSFCSLVKHRDEVENIILIHGFDVPLADTKTFALAEAQARDVARLFGKRLIVVRTNSFWEQPGVPGGWFMYYGAVLAAVAYALAPHHRKIFFASSYSYADLCPCGSHPLLDPLWSTETLKVIHDGGETRLEKLRILLPYPEALSRLRVCWENLANYNCGVCEKCVRTMLGLRVLGFEHCGAFPDTLKPELVRRQRLWPKSVVYWRELVDAGLPPALNAAVKSAIHSCDACLPPRSGKLKREINRWRIGLLHSLSALASPIDRS
jgi:hypothetical protein